jgi:hypothetical protein
MTGFEPNTKAPPPPTVQVCDATDDASSTKASYQKENTKGEKTSENDTKCIAMRMYA